MKLKRTGRVMRVNWMMSLEQARGLGEVVTDCISYAFLQITTVLAKFC
jgi:hypothetical protein